MENTNKTNKPKMIIIALIAISLILWVGYTLNQNKSIAEAKELSGNLQMELNIAKIPSEIEVMQKELEDNRETRSLIQEKIDRLVEDKKVLSKLADEKKAELADKLGL